MHIARCVTNVLIAESLSENVLRLFAALLTKSRMSTTILVN